MDFGPERKVAGVLVPVFSLRGSNDLGIGDTQALKEFISWAAGHRIGLVQILPVNEPGADNSPYNVRSAMAMDPLTIATLPDALPELEAGDLPLEAGLSGNGDKVDYEAVKARKFALLNTAFARFQALSASTARVRGFNKFVKEQAFWLEAYSLHRALIEFHKDIEDLRQWPAEHQSPAAAMAWLESLDAPSRKLFTARITFFQYIQWLSYSQWQEVRKFADSQGVVLVGDVPVGVSIFSTDVWQNPHLFDLKRSCGAPPEKVFKSDPFTEHWGQNWGFPLYKWSEMAKDNFQWWRQRLRATLSLFHMLRVDHALGFFRIYSFPWRPEENDRFTNLTQEEATKITGGPLPGFMDYDDSTEEHREYNKRHGEMVLKMFLEETGRHRLIAEDLGEVAPYVRPTLEKLEIPGFKIPQWERAWDRLTPGVSYPRLSLATFATHDHPPIKAFWEEFYEQSKTVTTKAAAIHSQWEFMDFCAKPDLPLPAPFTPEVHKAFLRGLLLSNAWIAVHIISDLLGNADRFNTPGSIGGTNWTQRIPCPIADLNSRYQETLAYFEKVIVEAGRA